MYALAASAAGVGVLTLAQPVDAKIIYTPAHEKITLGHPVKLELNRIGVVDFIISVARFKTVSGYSVTSLGVMGSKQGNSLVGHYYTNSSLTFARASALKAGRRIGPNLTFMERPAIMVGLGHSGCFGSWENVKRRYLGFKFRVNKGPTQYGWARLNASCTDGPSALLTGYAYESIPNRPVIAGKTKGQDEVTLQPANLGQLARGYAAAK
jgi:hypothetical protein